MRQQPCVRATSWAPRGSDALPTGADCQQQAQARREQGLALYMQGQREEALALYQEAARLAPEDVLGHFLIGLALMALNRQGEAYQEWRTVLALPVRDEQAAWAQHLVVTLLEHSAYAAPHEAAAAGNQASVCLEAVPQRKQEDPSLARGRL